MCNVGDAQASTAVERSPANGDGIESWDKKDSDAENRNEKDESERKLGKKGAVKKGAVKKGAVKKLVVRHWRLSKRPRPLPPQEGKGDGTEI